MIKIKGEGTSLDWQIINSIKDVSAKNVKFQNITFECETITDASGNLFEKREKGHWIPCSERLPDEKDAGILKKLGIEKRSEDVLATVEVKGERMTVTTCTYDGKWEWDMKYAFPDYKVIAWMPLPEPYRGGDQNG